IVDMATEVKITKTFIYTLINDHIDGKDIVAETSMAKFWASEMVRRVADASFEIFGLEGALAKNKIERAWRDCRGISIFAGTNQIMREIIAKKMGL
ncbi:MAG TPA: acyl-CoA dehydrogenase, partial [Desulfobacteraceae bacterium]|nr:acyl-CoA dehydrogenase [Desulfobacteraceae bacterium]